MKREWEIHAAQLLAGAGIPAVGEINFIAKAGGTTREYLSSDLRVPSDRLFATIPDAYAKVAGKRNGSNTTFLLSPDSHNLGATLTWAANMTHLVGMFPNSRMSHRSRIGMSTAFSPMITVSGYGNLFQNIYTMHGTAAADVIGWTISGARNSFVNCHFGGPMHADIGDANTYNGVNVTGSENYFKGCVLGTDTVGRDEATPNVTLGAGTLTIFEDCLFLLNATDTDPYFVKFANASGYTWALFKNCMFMAFSSNYAVTPAVALTFSGAASCAAVFDGNCHFQNVTALVDTAKDQHVYLPRTHATTTDTQGMISVQLTI